MKLVICDDNPADIDYVTGLINVWKRQAGTAVEILSFPSAEALHYLLKPVTQERLGQVLDRARLRITNREHMLQLTLQDGVVCLPVYEIRYLEVMRNYTTVHASEDYSFKRSLNDLEGELDESFYRIHRSFIVNMRFVRRVTRTEVVLKDGTALPLSRKHYEGLNQALIAYF